MGLPAPAPKWAKNPNTGQKRILGIPFSRGGVEGQTDPTFPLFLRVPDRFRRVRDPNGTILTTFGPPGGPAGPARARSEIFIGRGPGGPKFFPPRILFVQKRYSLGPESVLSPEN